VECSTVSSHVVMQRASHLEVQIRAYVDTFVYGAQFHKWVLAVTQRHGGLQQVSSLELEESFILDALAWRDGFLKLQAATKALQRTTQVLQGPLEAGQAKSSLEDNLTESKQQGCVSRPAATSPHQGSGMKLGQVKLFRGSSSSHSCKSASGTDRLPGKDFL